MRLLDHTDYALRTLLYLGLRGGPASAADIAAAYAISVHHERKVIQHLSAKGFVQTTRGRSGGVQLALPPEQIRIGAVVAAMEEDTPLLECFRRSGNACVLTPACGLKRVMAEARQAFLGTLNSYTLADLLASAHAPASAILLGLPPLSSP